MDKNIIFSSNAPWSVSGYGQQTATFVPRFQQLGYNMAVSCFYGLEGGLITWNGINCYPTDITRFGSLMLGEYARHHFGGDKTNGYVFTLQDVWCLNPGLQAGHLNDLRFVSWTPVDHDPCPPNVARFLRDSNAQVIALTKFGQRALAKEGIEAGWVPHGIDTNVFKPERDKRDQYRDGLSIPRDAFVVGMVACNQGWPSRKSFPTVLQAFKTFSDRHSDALLYVHADVMGRNNGVNLIELADNLGIAPEKVRTSDQTMLHLGIPKEMVAGVYNTFDVLCMPSMGEGFGIPLIEAQACGVPVITSDWTAMPELCGAGWLVQGERFYDSPQYSWGLLPYEQEIVDALEQAYEKADGMGEQAREFALPYDADQVMELWKPELERVTRPREIEPLRLAA